MNQFKHDIVGLVVGVSVGGVFGLIILQWITG